MLYLINEFLKGGVFTSLARTRIYIASVDALRDSAAFERLYASVSAERQAKIDRLSSEKEKRLSLAAELLLIRALRDIGISRLELEYGDRGKPYIKGDPVFFNISHSNERVICAISPYEVGCDVELIAECDPEKARRFFAPREYDYISSLKDAKKMRDEFFRLWTLKESFIKATGDGLSLPLKSFELELDQVSVKPLNHLGKTYFFKEYSLDDGYKYAVCALSDEFDEPITVRLN